MLELELESEFYLLILCCLSFGHRNRKSDAGRSCSRRSDSILFPVNCIIFVGKFTDCPKSYAKNVAFASPLLPNSPTLPH